ncbi:MAG: hypothetical protein EOM24_10870, partial [Chloroflexia bacterium]|nr:hypothetical protein [Chloroflexia bacterium]
MAEAFRSRAIAARLVVEGNLVLVTPAHLGNGDAESITAMPLLLDPVAQQPLLTGTSLAGALRGYLASYERGYGLAERDPTTLAVQLFGSLKGDDQGEQSPLIVDDAYGSLPSTRLFEVRDGVKIDGATRTADEKKKYDLELLPAGTCFPLRLELLLPAAEEPARRLRQALALALQGLMADDPHDAGAIALGARRSRGFGRCRVAQWRYTCYDLHDPSGLVAWVTANAYDLRDPPGQVASGTANHAPWGVPPTARWHGDANAIFGPEAALPSAPLPDARRRFQIHATFDLASPILIRTTDPLALTGEQPDAEQPDVAHLRSYRPDDPRPRHEAPVIPGTSLAGVLRARATRIVHTLHWPPSAQANALLDAMFGNDMHRERPKGATEPPQPTASRLIVEETLITKGAFLVQNRVAIDRFTGGAYDTALFAEAPHVGGDIALRLTLRLDALQGSAARQQAQPQAQHAQIGLLL